MKGYISYDCTAKKVPALEKQSEEVGRCDRFRDGGSTTVIVVATPVFFRLGWELVSLNAICDSFDECGVLVKNLAHVSIVDQDTLNVQDLLWAQDVNSLEFREKRSSATRSLID